MRALGVLLLLAGCDLFPEDLYMHDAAPADRASAPTLAIAETCGEAPLAPGPVTNAYVDLSTSRHDPDACPDAPGGPEAWFALAVRAGERWHVHVTDRNRLGIDPSLRVLPACADAVCPAGALTMNECGVGQDEHLSFVAETDGTWRVALEAQGGAVDVLVNQPVCGNGPPAEHAEGCDDGNRVGGDGCDARCRVELEDLATPREREPNDDPTMANHVVAPLVFTGEAGGRCDVDYFTFEHVGGPLRVGLTTGDGACAEPSLQVELLRGETSAALERLGAGDPGCGGLALDAPAGELHLRVRAAETAPGVTYRVALE